MDSMKTAINTINSKNFCFYLETAQNHFGSGQYQKSLSALLLAEELKELDAHPDLDAVSDDLMEILLKKFIA